MTEEADELMKNMLQEPIQFYNKPDELTVLQERWTSLIRNHGFTIVKNQNANNMTKPDLFDIANEIDAFFIALKSKK